MTSAATRPTLFLVGACVLGYEILLTRAASAFFQYHFAFLVLSIAMLSLFASGVLYQRLAPVSERGVHVMLWTLFGLLVVSPALFNTALSLHLLQVGLFVFGFIVLFSGSFITLHYLRTAADTGAGYAANLFGSALGAALATLSLAFVGPDVGVLLLAAFAAAMVILQSRSRLEFGLLAAFLVVSAGLSALLPQAEDVLWQRWNSFSYVKVMNQRGPVIWGSHGSLPPSLDLLIDSSADTAILTDLSAEARRDVARDIAGDITHVGYALAPQPLDVAIVGSGGGRDVVGAQYFQPRHVLAVEINPSVVDAVKRFSPETYANVELAVAEGRSTLEKSRTRYSIIQFGLVDTWAAVSSGTFALSENYLYTREAFAGYLHKLKPDGVLSMTRWGAESDRLLAIAAAGLRDIGVTDPDRHVLVIEKDSGSEWALITALIKPTPWSDAQRAQAQQIASRAGYQIRAYQKATSAPALDDSPFFFYTAEGSRVILQAIGALAVAALAIFLAARPRTFSWHVPTLLFFGAIGMGYMLVENVFLQKFILLIRNPTLAVSTVFLASLLFSGIGSLYATRVGFRYAALIVPVLLLFFAVSRRVIVLALTLSLGLKILLTIVCIAPAAFLMGLFFPTGFERVKASGRGEGMAWAVNGLFSVVAPPIGLLLAVTSGFGVVLLVAATLYTAAFVAGHRL